jgi:hypothetical protein
MLDCFDHQYMIIYDHAWTSSEVYINHLRYHIKTDKIRGNKEAFDIN